MTTPNATSPPPTLIRYVDEQTCLNSIIVSSIACVISVAFALGLFRRAFAEQLGHQFMASDSAIRFMTMRCRLLFFAAVLGAVDAASNVIQWVILYQATHLVDFVLVRVIFMLSIIAALPLQTYATCQRCAVIIAREHVKRERLLNTAFRTCVVSFVVMEGGVAYTTITMVAAGSKTTIQDWLTVLYMPPPVVAFMATMPLLIMFSSSWALSVNVQRGNHASSGSLPSSPGSTVSGSTRQQPISTIEHRPSIMSNGIGTTTTPSSAAPLIHPTSAIHQQSPTRSSSTAASPSMIAAASLSLSHLASLRARSKSLLTRSPSTHAMSRSQLSYPLSTSFTILTIGIIILWSIGLTATLFPIFPRVRRSPVNALVNACCLAFESSFERLLKFAKHKHHRRQSRLTAATAGFQGDEEDEGGLGHIGSVSGIGSWTAGTRLGHGPGEVHQPELEVMKEEMEASGVGSTKTSRSAAGAVVMATAVLEGGRQ